MLKQVKKLNERDLEPRFQGLLRGLVARVPFLKLESLKSDQVIRPQAAKQVKAAVARPDWLLSVKAGARPWTLVAEGKRLGQPREVRAGVLQLKHYLSLLPPRTSSYGMLLAPFISEESARICTEAGIGYADLAGNARLSFDQVFIETRAAENPFHEKRTVKSVFSPKATRVLRVLLRGPLRSWKVKELALEADVSLGHVSAVRQQLLAHEWAVENADGLLVSKPDGLFNAWIAADDWDARTTVREYSLLVSDPVEIATKAHAFLSESAIPHAFTQWIAAHFRHPHTTPPVTTVYVNEFPPDDAIKDRLLARRVDAGGRLRLVRPNDVGVLSQIQTTKRLPLVSDVQIYLDLIKAGQRGDDAAAELRRWPGLLRRLGMSKHETFADYPPRSLAAAEAALLTIWPTLNRYHDDLVLVGGLAVHYLTRRDEGRWPGAVTMDVDFGISLATEGGQYGTVQSDLAGLGFKPEPGTSNRLVRQVEDIALYVDFLTEAPPATGGSRIVDGITASVLPGINRALESRRMVEVNGRDMYGSVQNCELAVADIGPLLVLKLNAFGGPTGRRLPKDAYDVLLAVTSFIDGPQAALAAFQAEANRSNTAYDAAIEALKRDFSHIDSDAPIRAAEFLRGTLTDQRRVREELVTAAKFLLGE